MRLYQSGDEGEAVRDIQDRLSSMALSIDPDDAGSFGSGTERAVEAFQRLRGLRTDGIVGPDTWRALVGAGYRLGDRLLYHRVPMMTGDDVADLQRGLDALGFDIGKIDGIFGPDTLAGLLDFQANRRLPEDGIAGGEVTDELSLMARATSKPGKEDVREQQWLHHLPGHLVGQRIYVDPACGDEVEAAATFPAATMFANIIQDLGAVPVMSRSIDTAPPARTRAVRANRLGVDFVVSFSLSTAEPAAVLYFASEHSLSRAGKSLAGCIASRLDTEIAGRAIPMLKDTRAPSVVVQTGLLDEKIGGAVAQGVIDLFGGAYED